ncbi:MAG TPA: cell division protein FtsZ [Caulobacteraceae bacterium]|nr:cell division protein FtsZ [Caulobacteraceae bacterium]
MTISLSAPRTTELKPRIVIFGIGGAGGNAVNNMIDAGLGGVEFVVANTDAQQLQFSKTDRRVQLGASITQGLGAGAHPEVGMSAAQESEDEISEHLEGAHMVFITAGMGGGTGTGAAPVIAKCARERGILTVGVVTKPFTFEGRHRMRLADAGIQELQRFVDTLIIIPNQNLFRVANERTTFAEAFGMADQVLHSGVRSITDLMVLPGLINLDFADVRTVMSEMGKAMMGTGEASGDDRALHAAQNAIQNPLLDETSLKGAKAVLVNVTGGLDMTLLEVDEAANTISNEVDPEANIIFGAAFDPSLDGKIRVSVVATGMDSAAMAKIEPKPVAQPVQAVARPAPARPEVRIEDARKPEPAMAHAAQPAVTQPVMRTAEPRIERRVFGQAEPETVRSFDPEKHTVTGGRRVDIREPRVEEVRSAASTDDNAPIARIVDPLVADEESQGDLYLSKPAAVERTNHTTRLTPQPQQRQQPAAEADLDARYGEPRKSGWRGLFGGGRPRPEQQRLSQTQLRTTQQAQPVEAEAHEPAGQDDLEIPSFLRRLAN